VGGVVGEECRLTSRGGRRGAEAKDQTLSGKDGRESAVAETRQDPSIQGVVFGRGLTGELIQDPFTGGLVVIMTEV